MLDDDQKESWVSQRWAGKRVFVTGHTGFKGTWLVAWLRRLGADVVGYALPPATQPAMFDLVAADAGIRSVTGDVRDLSHLVDVVREAEPEVVFHLAAQALVRASFDDPVDTYATNVMGTVNVLEAIRRTPSVRAAVVVTSDKCYENREWHWGYRESEPMGGYDPYSNSKGCAELVTSSFRRSFLAGADVRVASGRAGNVIGGGDWAADRLIPDIVRSWSSGQPVLIRSPHSIRPWQHVLEPLSGYLALAERLLEDAEVADGWNFGPAESDAREVGWIVARMSELWGPGAEWSIDAGPHPHEATYLKLDCSKARAELGWRPRLDLATALEWTLAWYRTWQAHGDLASITDAQIEQYESIA
jgi:CDP-glucose 4,6-dehydratase